MTGSLSSSSGHGRGSERLRSINGAHHEDDFSRHIDQYNGVDGGRGHRRRQGTEQDEEEDEDAEGEGIQDQIIQSTDRDASLSRLSAVRVGYLNDPFTSLFLDASETVERRFPIINRGMMLFRLLM